MVVVRHPMDTRLEFQSSGRLLLEELRMAKSELRLIRRYAEFQEKEKSLMAVPKGTRGVYALLDEVSREGKKKYDVVYVGMTDSGIRGRLQSHKKERGDLWTHFSIFEVWPNITRAEIAELEGLFRHIYRKDTRANRVNRQRSFRRLGPIRNNKVLSWRKLSD
jgi:hypothetical protein